MRAIGIILLATLVLGGCRNDPTGPRDLTPPAAPRGLYTVTGDQTVYLGWLENTEPDVAGYRIYEAPCASGSSCPYERVGSTGSTTFTVTGLTNGVTRYYAVAAYDFAGNESDLTYETIFDTPRPEGIGAIVSSYLSSPAVSGWDFSAARVRAFDDPATDMFYGHNGSTLNMFVPDFQTDIQDAGYATSLDAVDFAPNGGWSPTGSVELIQGHCYVVWTRDNNYAKFRVTSVVAQPSGPPRVQFDWAYQVDSGNPELRARPVRPEGATRRPIAWVP
ncbi:MAG: hypothetical protein ACRENJ_05620 [Candidatus Eiseniibacteriota bacterium]